MTRTYLTIALLLAVLAGTACAEDLVLFQASTAGADAWTWAGARVKQVPGGLSVTEHNREGDYGDAFVSDRLPLYPTATLTLNVKEVVRGGYTLQIVAFKGSTPVGAVDLVKGSQELGEKTFSLDRDDIPPGTDSVLLKIWAVHAEGASVILGDLVYRLPLGPTSVLATERFQKTDSWEMKDAALALTPGGAKMTLAEGATYGSALVPGHRAKLAEECLLLDLGEVHNATVTLQLVALDASGQYLESLDVIKSVGEGLHGACIGNVPWPAATEQYVIKLWLGGQPDASAVLQRLLLFRP